MAKGIYSLRSAMMGSIDAALRAGIQAASVAIVTRTAAAAVIADQVNGRDLIQEPGHLLRGRKREGQADRQPQRHDHQGVAHDQPQHGPTSRAERDAHAELRRPARHV